MTLPYAFVVVVVECIPSSSPEVGNVSREPPRELDHPCTCNGIFVMKMDLFKGKWGLNFSPNKITLFHSLLVRQLQSRLSWWLYM